MSAASITLGRLAAAERVRPSTISNTVAGLVDAGLVRREPSASDARSVIVRPTAEGRRVLAEGRRRRVAVITGALDRLPPGDLETVSEAVTLIERVLTDPR